jgi:hypothetical protein
MPLRPIAHAAAIDRSMIRGQRSTIIDAHHDRTIVGSVRHLNARSEGQSSMRRWQRVHVEALSAVFFRDVECGDDSGD